MTKRLVAIGIRRKGEDSFTTIGEFPAVMNGKTFKLVAEKYKDGDKWKISHPPRHMRC